MKSHETGRSPNTTEGSPRLSEHSASACEHMTDVLRLFSIATQGRTSIRLMLAFAIIARANAMGQSISLTDVREIAEEALGQGIERTIGQLFPPNKQMPDALGWVEQVPDEDDRRRKYLRLTERGREIVNEMTAALND